MADDEDCLPGECAEWRARIKKGEAPYGSALGHGMMLFSVVRDSKSWQITDRVEGEGTLYLKAVNLRAVPRTIKVESTHKAKHVRWMDCDGAQVVTELCVEAWVDKASCCPSDHGSQAFRVLAPGRAAETFKSAFRGPQSAKRPVATSHVSVAPESKTSSASTTRAQAATGPAPRVFVSYCHTDKQWLHELEKMLALPLRYSHLALWTDDSIRAGDRFRSRIADAVETADAGLLLVTSNFWASRFIAEQEYPALLDAAKSGQKKLFWIAVNHSLDHLSDLKEIACLNDPKRPLAELDDKERDKELKAISEKLLRALS